jgi:diguanylate cyclase (GGDEF)-like protein
VHSPARIGQASPSASDPWEDARLEALGRLDILDSPPEPAFDRIARLIKNIFGVDIAIVSMIDAHRQWYKACIGMPVGEVPRRDTFCTLTIREAEPVVSNDTTKDPRFADNPYVVGEPYVRFYAGVPLRTADGHAVGTLCAIHSEPKAFGDREVAILRDLADVVMAEIELRQLASTDVLTGTMSRRAFEEDGANAVALSLRHKTHLSCIAVDLDHFKRVNDTYGHAAGDKTLVTATNAIKESLRQSDRIARIGGEEFVILLPHTNRAGALEVAEKLREKIEATPIDVGAVKIGITASFGVAALDIATKDLDLLLAHADTALYEAKSGGRNKCVAWRSAEADAAVRRRVLKAGQVIFNGRQSAIDCTVRSLSEEGASLDVSSTLGIPSAFMLAIRADGFETECRVVSRTERRIEVEFR